MGNMKRKALLDTVADTQTESDSETLRDTVVDL